MDATTNPAFVIFAAVSPLLIALVKQAGLSRQINALIALACYVGVGLLGVILSGEALTLDNSVQLVATATVVGSAAYGLIWSNLGANEEGEGSVDDRITEATSVIK